MQFKNRNDLYQYSRKIIGKKVYELDKNNLLNESDNKGIIGQLVEMNFFGKPLDSAKNPDFKLIDGSSIELKVTPVKKNKNNTISSKERLVLGLINYNEIYKQNFEESDLLSKIREMLLIFYMHDPKVSKSEFEFVNTAMYDLILHSEDYKIIKNDYNTLITKIKAGKAHEISEADTFYLSACTKGANAKSSQVTQPFNEITARRRAFAFKASYMTAFYNNLQSLTINDKNFNDPRKVISDSLNRYRDISLTSLADEFTIKKKAKQFNHLIIKKIIEKENLSHVIDKANIIIKTVPLKKLKSGIYKAKESMKLINLKENEFSIEWQESTVSNFINENIFLFVFIYNDSIMKVSIHNFSYEERLGLEEVWSNTKNSFEKGIYQYPLPKISNSSYAHIRPCGKNAEDTYKTPHGEIITKQAFWINSSYISTIFNNY